MPAVAPPWTERTKGGVAVQFGIQSIPAMFLLEQSGNVVSAEARGPKLEVEIKRLLKL